MDSPILASHMQYSSFNPATIRSEPTTVYLVLPHDRVTEYSALLRLWVGCIIRAIMADGPTERNPVLFILDEAAHMGRIKLFEDAVSLYRGYGIRLWFIFQSIAQVQEVYGEKAQVFLDNIDTQQFFGVNSFDSAEAISKRCGEVTLKVRTTNSGSSSSTGGGDGKSSTSYSRNGGVSYSEIGRRLFFSHEILGMRDDASLVFHRNMPVLPVRLVRYYEDRDFRRGGTGQPRVFGIAACLLACAMLACSLLFVGVMALIPAILAVPDDGAPARPRPGMARPGRLPNRQSRRYRTARPVQSFPTPYPYAADPDMGNPWGW
jgi:type IV secretion system protein VirD4